MTPNDFIHPDDALALKTLKSIPALKTVMEKIFQYGYDEIEWAENVTTNIRLSEQQMPEIYNRLPPICEKLGIPMPELYLQMSNVVNAWTSGNDRVYIVITLGLIKKCKGEELDAVLAHECGHIVCRHVLYKTLANAIFSMGDTFLESIVSTVTSVVLKPIRQALITWSRAAELSADRVACVITSAETLSRALARIDLIPKYIVDQMDIHAWAEQGKDYEALKSGTAWNKVVRWMANSDADHPFSPVRAYHAFQWEKTDICQVMKNSHTSLNLSTATQTLTSYTDDVTDKVAAMTKDLSVEVVRNKVSQLTKEANVGSVLSKFGIKK